MFLGGVGGLGVKFVVVVVVVVRRGGEGVYGCMRIIYVKHVGFCEILLWWKSGSGGGFGGDFTR